MQTGLGGPNAAQARDKGAVIMQMDQYESLRGRLTETISQLEARLQSVLQLRPADPGKAQSQPPIRSLAEALLQGNEQLSEQINRLQDIISRLEL